MIGPQHVVVYQAAQAAETVTFGSEARGREGQKRCEFIELVHGKTCCSESRGDASSMARWFAVWFAEEPGRKGASLWCMCKNVFEGSRRRRARDGGVGLNAR